MHSTRVALRSIVDEVVAEVVESLGDRSVEWRVGPLPELEADAAMLRQVFRNLIGNAVKYTGTREHALIEIGTTQGDESKAVVFVRDNGVGFDMTYADKLFGVFQRLHRVDEFEGTGVGLANVRRIVERHGGATWAEGRVGLGAVFYFSLPLKAESQACAS
jgi:light-regulated signal transduction histidine kinase (bacteriophytochrome)